MKGITGIIVAIGLGIAGAAANLFYLHTEAQKVDTISFIGIEKGATIGRGERLPEDKLVEVKIPRTRPAISSATPTAGKSASASKATSACGGRWAAESTASSCSATT